MIFVVFKIQNCTWCSLACCALQCGRFALLLLKKHPENSNSLFWYIAT